MDYIPNARELTGELSSRVHNLVISQPIERMASDGIHRLTSYEVFDRDKRLGIVEVNSWDARGVTQIAHVTYEGVVPGYRNDKRIMMTATELSTLDVSDPEYLRPQDFTKPNNTQQKPLYRHDGHPLRLASHEVNGKNRVVLSEAEASRLEEDIARLSSQ